MHLEVRRLPGHVGVRGRVGLIKAITGELFHQVEDFGGRFSVHAALGRARDEDGALTLHFLDVFLTHGAAQQVGAA